MKRIILASSSPRRRELLEQFGIKAEIIPSGVDEESDLPNSPDSFVKTLSRRKADTVLKLSAASDAIIIAADTIVYHNGEVLGKPSDIPDAVRMLTQLSGGMHEVYTGLTVEDSTLTVTECERTAVYFRELSPSEIETYVRDCSTLDKAGAYGIQDKAGLFVARIDGDFYNIVGMPMCRLAMILTGRFGLTI